MDDDSKQAWMKVGLHFAAAGDKLREHAKGAASGAKAWRAACGSVATTWARATEGFFSAGSRVRYLSKR